ncbi:MAG: hypothetical protein CML29_17375 [Rhizobiales bacterium]|nr:hypothetical protein [Hyphomicrobiales bacterium]MBA68647.1 hypothetical protein [Hyphomicrobiales bacterium]
MTAAHRLTIVTNEPLRAARDVLGVDFIPAWCRVVTRAEEVASLADSTKVIGQWYEPRSRRSLLEWAFIARRERGGLIGLSLEDCDKLVTWGVRNGAGSEGMDPHRAVAASQLSGLVVSERRVEG